MTTAEAELELAPQKRPRDDEEAADAAAAAAPVADAAPAAKAARLEEDVTKKSSAPDAATENQPQDTNDASICDAASAADPDAADAAAAAAAAAPKPEPAPPSTSAALLGLPQRWDANQLRRWLLEELRCDFTTCRKKRGGALAFVTFPSVDARRAADAAAKRAKKVPGGGRLVLRDDRGGQQNQNQKQQQVKGKRASEIDVRDVVTPLWRLSYERQLALKAQRLRGVLQRIEGGIGGTGKNPPAAIEFMGILRSPTTSGYRNKCEFTVGLGVSEKEDGEKSVGETRRDGEAECGFCLGAYRDGIVEVGPASACGNVSGVAKSCASAFTKFMRERSKLAPWDKRHNRGFWRLLIVREGRKETVLPRPQNSPSSANLAPPPPPFASLDWRPWLVSAADLAEEKEETTEGGEKAAATEDAAAPVAAAAAAAAAAVPPPPSPSFEAPPADEILLVVQVDPTAPEASEDAALVREELTELGRVLRAAVEGCRASFPGSSSRSPSSSLPTRLVLQHHSGLSNSAPEDAPLLPWPEEEDGAEEEEEGKEEKDSGFVTDALCGLRFRVSPSSFFQVNSGAAALLYRLALDWAGLGEEKKGKEEKKEKEGGGAAGERGKEEEKERGENGENENDSFSVLLDVCCGTGTIGICAAAAGAKRVVGVDIVAAAIRDAEANAAANGLSVSSSSSSTSTSTLASSSISPSPPPSCRFVAAKAEDVMASLLAEERAAGSAAAEPPRFVAVVDPPRAGLHPKVRGALRACPSVSRVVYVSCNPDTLASDCVSLCTRGGNGRAFRAVRAVAADLFPMTAHCEAVVLLER